MPQRGASCRRGVPHAAEGCLMPQRKRVPCDRPSPTPGCDLPSSASPTSSRPYSGLGDSDGGGHGLTLAASVCSGLMGPGGGHNMILDSCSNACWDTHGPNFLWTDALRRYRLPIQGSRILLGDVWGLWEHVNRGSGSGNLGQGLLRYSYIGDTAAWVHAAGRGEWMGGTRTGESSQRRHRRWSEQDSVDPRTSM